MRVVELEGDRNQSVIHKFNYLFNYFVRRCLGTRPQDLCLNYSSGSQQGLGVGKDFVPQGHILVIITGGCYRHLMGTRDAANQPVMHRTVPHNNNKKLSSPRCQ